MNHCRDCNSDYATPGTCNCFAVGGKRHAAPHSPWYPVPYIPYVPPVYPWYPYYGSPTFTITGPADDGTTVWFDARQIACTPNMIGGTTGGSFDSASGNC